jgi:predicted permease
MTLTGLAADVRVTLVQLRRSPAFTLTAVLTLAIGAGANTGIVSLLDGFLRPLPVPRPHEIVIIAADTPGDETGFRYRFSYPALADYRAQNDVFADVFAFDARLSGLTANGRTTLFTYQIVTGNFFSGLELEPVAGRLFAENEGEGPAGEVLIVLGHAYWLSRFGGDPAVVGTTVRIDGQPAQIIGVAPPGFHGMFAGAEMQGYAPIGALRRGTPTPDLFTDRTLRPLTLGARLKRGVSLASAQATVDVIARRLHAQYPLTDRETSARVLPEPLARPLPLRFLTDLMPLVRAATLALAALVLLIACMNVANLLLVRASVRQREIAVRSALGSGRWRLVRLMLIESVVLAAAGTAIGLVLARWATNLFLGSINLAVEIPVALEFDYDWRMFGYATVITVATGLVTGIVPALRAARGAVNPLHEGGRSGSDSAGRQRLRRALVVAQVAGSLVLLIVAGLFVRSLQEAHRIDLGFDPEHLLTVRLDPRQLGYSEARSAEFYDQLERRLLALPGVDNVATAFTSPMGYIFDACVLIPDDTVRQPDDPQNSVSCNAVGSTYFDTMRIPLVRGRRFTTQDDDGSARVAIVNETMARRQWPGEDPIGKRLRLERRGDSVWEVVGVVRDSKYLAAFESPLPHIYLPIAQNAMFLRVVFVRSALAPEALGPQLEREIRALDAEMPIADLKSMAALLEGGMGVLLFRWGTMQAAAMGLAGLLLAIIGVYGVVSYSATQRAREMAIRMALGAEPRRVAALVLRQGSGLVAAGIACGLLVALLVTRAIAGFFFVVSATDAITFVAVTALLSVIAIVACYLPAKRVMRLDPMTVLRRD